MVISLKNSVLTGVIACAFFSCQKPSACFSIESETIQVGVALKCDASCSEDAETYNWGHRGPGSAEYKNGVMSSSSTNELTFDTPGTYTIELEVENGNKESKTSKTVTVN